MSNFDCLINTASWEERYHMRTSQLIREHSIKRVMTIVVDEYEFVTDALTDRITSSEYGHRVEFERIDLTLSDNLLAWRAIEKSIEESKLEKVIFDISTCPRELIWYVLHHLDKNGIDYLITYSKPNSYGDWLSKDPGRPRLIYKHSGMTKLASSTALLLASGFDLERAAQLIQFYEPKVTYLATQVGEQYDNLVSNLDKNISFLKESCEVVHFTIDAFTEDGGASDIEKSMRSDFEKYNFLACSLGPKPSAFALYKLQKKYPNIGLCYVPSLQYNTKDYSKGISEHIYMKL